MKTYNSFNEMFNSTNAGNYSSLIWNRGAYEDDLTTIGGEHRPKSGYEDDLTTIGGEHRPTKSSFNAYEDDEPTVGREAYEFNKSFKELLTKNGKSCVLGNSAISTIATVLSKCDDLMRYGNTTDIIDKCTACKKALQNLKSVNSKAKSKLYSLLQSLQVYK